MLKWITSAILGFLGAFLSDLYSRYAANSALREAGRLEAENEALKTQIEAKEQAQAIRDKNNAETDFNHIIDGL